MGNNGTGYVWRWRQHGVLAGVAVIAAVFGVAAALVVSGREKTPTQAPIISNGSGADPALANLASPVTPAAFPGANPAEKTRTAHVLSASAAYAPQSSGETYPPGQQAPAPIVRGNSSSQNESLQYNTQPPAYSGNAANSDPNAPYPDPNAPDANAPDPNAPMSGNVGYADASAQENAGYEALEQADQAPPPLPVYDQPPAPEDNYLWTPGYWGYSTGYFWVPGAWVAPPFYGALWTPPWWGWYGGRYCFHRGYWGTHIGYYGGINYGFGYVGSGFYGGYWQGRSFFYNRAVTNVNITRVHNVYERSVIINNVVYTGRPSNRTSFNGPGGVRAQPHAYEVAAAREAHYAPVPAQVQVRQMAATSRAQFFDRNQGRPAETFHPQPLGVSGGIANGPRTLPTSQQQYRQAAGGQNTQPATQEAVARSQGSTAEIVRRPAPPSGAVAAPRNDLIQQRTGLWNGDREHNGQDELQRSQQVRQQQRETADQQRSLQLQQQQQQRNAQQQQQRNAQQQQQREAADQQRILQLQQQQTQRLASEQQGRSSQQQLQQQQQQQQQQRQAAEQQRSLQFQQQQQQRLAAEQQRSAQPQAQHIQAAPQPVADRPAPHPMMQQPHGEPHAAGSHGRPQ